MRLFTVQAIFELWNKLLTSFQEVDLMSKIEPPNNFRIVFLMDDSTSAVHFEHLPGILAHTLTLYS